MPEVSHFTQKDLLEYDLRSFSTCHLGDTLHLYLALHSDCPLRTLHCSSLCLASSFLSSFCNSAPSSLKHPEMVGSTLPVCNDTTRVCAHVCACVFVTVCVHVLWSLCGDQKIIYGVSCLLAPSRGCRRSTHICVLDTEPSHQSKAEVPKTKPQNLGTKEQ